MADKKIYLDQVGLERLVDYIKNELSYKADKGEVIELPEDLVYEADLADYAKNKSRQKLNSEDYKTSKIYIFTLFITFVYFIERIG